MTQKTGGTNMLKHVAYVALFVSDQDQALDFYTKVVGFEKRWDNPTPEGVRFLTVGVAGQAVELVLWPGTPGQGKSFQGRAPAACTIEVESCQKTFETLTARGVTFESPVLEFPWGYAATFCDADGNRLTLREGRPGFAQR
jgi:predicted enzyme related to lactoylglutathione lyase